MYLTPRVVTGHLLVVLCTLGSAMAAGTQEGPSSAAHPGTGRLTFSHSAPFMTEDFLEVVRRELRTEKIENERLNDIYWNKKSRLLWAGSDNGSNLAWGQAVKHCENLELGDFADWRLPSIDELEGLHDPSSRQTFKIPQKIKLSACCQWSTTKHTSTSAWNFSFRFRKAFSGSLTYSLDLRALCVRGPIDELPIDWPQDSE